MRVIIAGTRSISLTIEEIEAIVQESGFTITRLVSGMAKGVDTSGVGWARSKNIQVLPYPANWSLHGEKAGPMRNSEMAKAAEALILIWNGESHGSADMLRKALKRGLRVHEVILQDGTVKQVTKHPVQKTLSEERD